MTETESIPHTATGRTLYRRNIVMFASSVIARGKAAIAGNETEQRLSVLLYDDSIQVISSFELNQLASLTYHDTANGVITSQVDMTDVLLDHLEKIQSQPIKFSTLTVQKSLIVTRHVLFYGAEAVVPRIRQQLGRHIEPLCQYNTVLAAQQSGSTSSWLMRLQGGAVDQAGPIRASAVPVLTLLTNQQQLQLERQALADPNSLVPIGNRQQVAFSSDQVRLEQLKKRMQEQQNQQTRSNLAKADNGFGSGYNAANGKTVVGAAHGIEEMLRRQQKEEQKFSDEKAAQAAVYDAQGGFAEYRAPNLWSQEQQQQPQLSSNACQHQQPQQHQQQPEIDLLAMDNFTSPLSVAVAAPTVDLLDFGDRSSSDTFSRPTATLTPPSDFIYGSATAAVDILGQQRPPPPPSQSTSSFPGTNNDPFQDLIAPVPMSSSSNEPHTLSNLLPMGSLTMGSSSNNTASNSLSIHPTLSMPTPANQISALDALSIGHPNNNHFHQQATLNNSGVMNGRGASFVTIPVPQPPSQPSQGATAFANLGGWNSSSIAASITDINVNLPTLSSLQQQHPVSVVESQSMAFAVPSTTTTMAASSSLRMSTAPPMGNESEHSDNGFLMGGAQGMGLDPLGQAPAAPPPLPPGSYY